jgi:hypothetical protein
LRGCYTYWHSTQLLWDKNTCNSQSHPSPRPQERGWRKKYEVMILRNGKFSGKILRKIFHLTSLFIPHVIWVWRVTVEWYWQGKTEDITENPVPVPFCPPQILHELTQAWTQTTMVRGRRLTTWAMAQAVPYMKLKADCIDSLNNGMFINPNTIKGTMREEHQWHGIAACGSRTVLC